MLKEKLTCELKELPLGQKLEVNHSELGQFRGTLNGISEEPNSIALLLNKSINMTHINLIMQDLNCNDLNIRECKQGEELRLYYYDYNYHVDILFTSYDEGRYFHRRIAGLLVL